MGRENNNICEHRCLRHTMQQTPKHLEYLLSCYLLNYVADLRLFSFSAEFDKLCAVKLVRMKLITPTQILILSGLIKQEFEV